MPVDGGRKCRCHPTAMCTASGPGTRRWATWRAPARRRWSWGCPRSPSPNTSTTRCGPSPSRPRRQRPPLASLAGPDGLLTPPDFDAPGTWKRSRVPRPVSGAPDPQRPGDGGAALARRSTSRRCSPLAGSTGCSAPCTACRTGTGSPSRPGSTGTGEAAEVLREYLAEVAALVTESDAFSVLAHIDYPVRSWPAAGGAVRPHRTFEEEFRHALRATAQSGRALEVSTAVPLHATILRWWHEEGGDAITFGSDAHAPGRRPRIRRRSADGRGVRLPPRHEPLRPVGPGD